MTKMPSSRLILAYLSLLLVTLACNAPGRSSSPADPEEQSSTADSPQPGQSQLPGYREILPDQPAELSTSDGASTIGEEQELILAKIHHYGAFKPPE